MLALTISKKIKTIYPEALLGVLAMKNVSNPQQHEGLDQYKLKIESSLREKFAGLVRADLKKMEPINAYRNYYKKFKKSYHVLFQLESIVLKNKSIPKVASLVEAMFMAELKNHLLTAGHDLDALHLPIQLDVADGTEKYIMLNRQEKELLRDDMFISDSGGIMSSIIYGPDLRTRINPNTKNVLFTVYAPPGVEKSEVFQHLQDIRDYVHIITPDSKVELIKVFGCKDV
jgi:DNA/RNA-binding domain of Phe-tRNA-synthetase-like protein